MSLKNDIADGVSSALKSVIKELLKAIGLDSVLDETIELIIKLALLYAAYLIIKHLLSESENVNTPIEKLHHNAQIVRDLELLQKYKVRFKNDYTK